MPVLLLECTFAVSRGLTFSWHVFALFRQSVNWKQIDVIFDPVGAVRWLAARLVIRWKLLRAALLSNKTVEGPVRAGRHTRVVYATALGPTAIVISTMLHQPAPNIVYKAR